MRFKVAIDVDGYGCLVASSIHAPGTIMSLNRSALHTGWFMVLALLALSACTADPTSDPGSDAFTPGVEARDDASEFGEAKPLPVKREMTPSFDVGQVIEKVRHVVQPDPDHPARWRAADPVYRATHEGQRFTFTPLDFKRGGEGDALSWRTTSIRSGQTELVTDGATRAHDENRVTLSWPGVRERYDHRDGHVEQSWDLDRLPERGAPLVITGEVSGATLVEATDSGLHLETPSGQLIAYSKATVFDAAGRRLHVDPIWAEGRVTITVGDAWLSKATFPITVDPTFTPEQGIDDPITSLVPTDAARTDLGPAVAYDGTRYLVVWVEGGLALSFDDKLTAREGIYGTIVETNGTILTAAGFGISVGDYVDWGQPAATSDGSNWYVVWTDKRDSGADPFVLRGALVNDSDLNDIALTEVTISDEAVMNHPSDPAEPDVDSDGNGFMVVFEATSGGSRDILYRLINSSGVVQGSQPINITSTAGVAEGSPSVAGTSARYAAVWTTGAVGNLEGRAYQGGSFDASSLSIATSNTDASSEPDIDCELVIEVEAMVSVNRYYCTVVWSGTFDAAEGDEGRDIFAQRLEIDTALTLQGSQENLLATADGNTMGGVNQSGDQTQPTVARVTTSAGSAHTVAYVDEDAGAGDIKVLTQFVGVADDDFTGLQGLVASNLADAQSRPAVARTDNGSIIAWTNSTDRSIEANIFEVDGMLNITSVDRLLNQRANAQIDPSVTTNGTDYLVAWSDDRAGNYDVYASRVQSDGTVTDTTAIALATNGGEGELNAVTCSDGTDYLVAWVRGGDELEAQRLNADGTTNGSVISVATAGAGDVFGPLDCESNGADYGIAWRVTNAGGDSDTVRSVQVRSNGSTRNDVSLATSTANNLGDPAISAGGNSSARFIVVWPGAGGGSIKAQRLASNGSTTGGVTDVVTSGANTSVDVTEVGPGYAIGWIDTTGTEAVELIYVSEDLATATPAGGAVIGDADNIDGLQLGTVDTEHVALIWRTPANRNYDLVGAEAFASSDGVSLIGSYTVIDTVFEETSAGVVSGGDGKAMITYQRFVPGDSANTDRSRARIGTYNRRPVAAADTYTTPEDTPLSITMASNGILDNDTDPDMGDTLTVDEVTDDVNNGTLSVNSATGTFTYTPNLNYNGPDSFTYTVTDGSLTSKPIMVSITVDPRNDSPVANDDNMPGYSVDEDGTLEVAVVANGVLDNDTDVDGDILTAVLADNVDNGTLSLNSDGTFTYSPASNFNGTDSFTYNANDGTASSPSTATVLITVNPVNDRPVVANDPNYTMDEDDTLNIAAGTGVLANDSDPDGDDLSVVNPGTVTASSGSLTLNADGSFSYTPVSNFNGTVTFSYRATDGSLNSNSSATVTITVNPLNDPPIAMGNSYSTNEETRLSVSAPGVLAGDSDPDGDDIDVLVVDDVNNGNLNMNEETGAFTYDPEVDFFGTDSFTYRAVDPDGAQSAEVTVTITVNNVQDSPVAVADAYSTNEETELVIPEETGVLANDSDPDGDDIDVIITDGVDNGSLSMTQETGAFSYTPGADFNGTDSFSYQATDGTRQSNTVTVTITVNNTNDSPTVDAGGPYTGTEGSDITLTAVGDDPDLPGDTLTYAWDFDNDGQYDDASGASVQYPAIDGPATEIVRVRIRDSSNNEAFDNATITVNNANPVIQTATSAPETPVESQSVSFSASATDAGSIDTLSYSWNFGDGTNGSGTSPSHTYTDNGNYTVTLTVTDKDNATDTQTLMVNVGQVAPSLGAISGEVNINEGSTNTWSSLLTKARFDDVDWSISWGDSTPNSTGSVNNDILTSTISSSHIYGDEGTFTLRITATDDDVQTDEATLVVTVNNVNPVIQTVSTDNNQDEGTSFSFSATATDAGTSDTLTYTWNFDDDSPPQNGQQVEHVFEDDGDYNVVLTVTDPDTGSATRMIPITVNNADPEIDSTTVPGSGNEGTSLGFSASASDVDADTLTYTWNFGDDTGNQTGSTISHTYTQNGTYTVTITVTDEDGGSVSQQSTVVIANVPPELGSTTIPGNGNEGAQLNFAASASDDGADALTYTWNFGDGTGNQTGATISHTYADNDTYTVTITVEDQDGDTDTASATVTINNVTPTPSIDSGDFVGSEGPPAERYEGSATDPGDDTLTYTWNFGDNTPEVSGVDRTNVSHTYLSDGVYTLTLTVEDEDGDSASTSRQVTIGGEGPALLDLRQTNGADEEAETFVFTAEATEPGNDDISYRWDFGDDSPIRESVDLTDLNHVYEDDGTYTITLTVSDDDGSAQGTLQVEVANVDPTITALTGPPDFMGAEGERLDFSSMATDPGDDTLTYTWSWDDGTSNTVSQNPFHTYADDGTYTVTLTVTDEDGGRRVRTEEVVIANTNPRITSFSAVPSSQENTQVTFQASAEDDGGANDPLTYTWNFGDGTNPATGASVNHTYRDNGVYMVVLTVTDDDTGSVTRNHTITVTNVDPTVGQIQGPNEGDEAAQLEFSVTASDQAGNRDPLTYTWDFGDGSTPRTGGSELATVQHTYADNRNYTVTLTIDDGDGGVVERSKAVTVNNVNPSLSAITGDSPGNEGSNFRYTAQATDVAGARDPLTYTWTFGDGSPEVSGIDRTNVSHIYRQQGEYTVRLTVTDDDNGTATRQFSVVVNNVAPNLQPGNDVTSPEGSAVLIRARAADPGDDTLLYTWDFGDSTPEVSGVDRTEVSHTYVDNGVYSVTVTVDDDDEGVVSANIIATIVNVPPDIISLPSMVGQEGQPYTYQVEAADPGDDEITYALERSPLGMQISDTGLITWTPTPEQAIQEPPIFTVRVRVADDDNGSDVQQWEIDLDFQDRDGDGSPDDCEDQYSTSPNPDVVALDGDDPCDGDQGGEACQGEQRLDNDMDGISNTQECLTGTHPLVSNAPSAPSIHEPLDGSKVTSPFFVLIVNNAIDPDGNRLSYTFELYDDAALNNLVFSDVDVPEQPEQTFTELADIGLSENVDYYWRARARDNSGFGPWSDVATFQYTLENDAPGVPNLVGQTNALRPTFTVDNASDIEGDPLVYEFQIFTEGNMDEPLASSPRVEEGGGDTTEWTLGSGMDPLQENLTYAWRARALDAGNPDEIFSPWSGVRTFQVNTENTPPEAPVILYPEGGRVFSTPDAVTLIARAAVDIDFDPLTYTFQVADNDAFTDAAVVSELTANTGDEGEPTEVGVAVTDALPELTLQDDTTYWWRVYATDADGDGAFSESTFRYSEANDPPSGVTLQSPGDGEVVDRLNPPMVWNNATDPENDAITYSVEVYTDEALTQLLYDVTDVPEGNGSTSRLTPPGLEDDTAYWWRARATDAEGASSDWSDAARFFIDVRDQVPTAPVLIEPSASAEPFEDGAAVVFVWQNSTDPEGSELTYELEIWTPEGSRLFFNQNIPEGEDGTTMRDPSVENPGDAEDQTLTINPGNYYWRVRAREGSDGQFSPWSPSGTFSMAITAPDPDAGIPEPVEPEPVYAEASEDCACAQPAAPAPTNTRWLLALAVAAGALLLRRRS